jgi:predicted DCC family thiol-disulfide oxidoreductase YuxK
MESPALTLYIDGNCPLCVAEMHRLRAWDKHGRLGFIDIAQAGFDPARLGVELAALNRQMHGWTADGRWVIGVDSIVEAYTLAGKGWLVLPLRVPFMRPAYRAIYRAFARNRIAISRWLGVKPSPVCPDDRCAVKAGPFR